MEQLYEIFDVKLRNISMGFKRFLFEKIDWNNRLISILGARGVGKTTLMLQYIKEKFGAPSKEILYVDVNHAFFSQNSLIDLADRFYKRGGKYLFLDEIHKYPRWSVEIKQIYDTFAGMQVVFSGSSILEILKGEADLSRRIVRYLLPGLSFREFLAFDRGLVFPPVDFQMLLQNHLEIAHTLLAGFRPFEHFSDYLRYGYYPYFIENRRAFPEKLLNTLDLILEVDLPAADKIDFNNILKLKKLLSILAQSVPFKPNTQKLSELVGVSRVTLLKFFTLLERARLLWLLNSATKGVRKLGKPDKVYLNNTNLMHVLAPGNANVGTLRETFFYNQMAFSHKVELPKTGDFLVDDQYLFEIGGKNKTQKQIAGLDEAYVVKDNLDSGAANVLPLWVFGFFY